MDPRPIVFVVDDDEAVRTGVSELLRSTDINYQVFCSAEEFIDAFDSEAYGCLLLDVRMPTMTGLELQDFLHERDLQIPIIMMSGKGDVPSAVRAMKAGAVDFLEKPFGQEALLDCIRRAIQQDAECHRLKEQREAVRASLSRLTPRERDVYKRLIMGEKVEQIAQRLGLSPKTIYIHRDHVLKKMGVESVHELIHLAALETGQPLEARR